MGPTVLLPSVSLSTPRLLISAVLTVEKPQSVTSPIGVQATEPVDFLLTVICLSPLWYAVGEDGTQHRPALKEGTMSLWSAAQGAPEGFTWPMKNPSVSLTL